MLKRLRIIMNGQQGFTLVELMVVIAVIGILAVIAIPRFTGTTELANGAKMAADLRTIDSAIAIAVASGKAAAAVESLKSDATVNSFAAEVKKNLSDVPKPPIGKYRGNHTTQATDIPQAEYGVNADGRAVLGLLKAEDI